MAGTWRVGTLISQRCAHGTWHSFSFIGSAERSLFVQLNQIPQYSSKTHVPSLLNDSHVEFKKKKIVGESLKF